METRCLCKKDTVHFEDARRNISVALAMSTNLAKEVPHLKKTKNKILARFWAKIGLRKTQQNV